MEQDPTMDTGPIKTSISTLPTELLLLIFEMNADMFSDINALKDTHRTALVSQKWRQILVDSPSIWGKLIDLNILCKDSTVKEDWVNEILRRSEGALLWIRGSVSERQNQSRAWMFFHLLIKNNWTRIQRFVVDVGPLSMDDHSTTWQTILQPAPNLETFKVRSYHDNSRDGLDFDTPMTTFVGEDYLLFFRPPLDRPLDLFSNHAPSLREFEPTQMYFSLSASWLSNLRSVSLTSPVSLHKIFQAIEQMPQLERLELEEVMYPPDQSTLPHLSCPRLTAIVLSDFLCVCSLVLSHINPAQGCSLSLSALDPPHSLPTTPDLQDAHQALSKYMKLFYQSHTATRIALSCSSDAFSFTDTTSFGANPPFFIFNLQFCPKALARARFHDGEFKAFTDLVLAFTFGSASFPFAHTLYLHFDAPSLYTSFLTLSAFSAIEALHTQESSLAVIRQLDGKKLRPGSVNFPFPALKTLRLTGIKEPSSVKAARISPLILFLDACRDHGCPVSVLEVCPTIESPRLGYLSPLGRILDQEMAGMMVKVLSQDGDGREVVCGGGNAYRVFLEY